MSDERSVFRPEPDEVAVHHPALQQLVEAVRAQPAPRVGLEPEALHAAWKEHRDRRRTRWGVGLAAAAVALLVSRALLSSSPEPDRSTTEAGGMAEASSPDPSSHSPTPSAPEASAPTADRHDEPAPPRLAAAVEVAPLGSTTGLPEVLGEHRLGLRQGHWSIDSKAPELVTVELPDGTLELRGGHVRVEIAADVSRVEVVRDEVLRLRADGSPAVETPASPTASPGPSADALAQQAEEQLAAGRRGQAIETLRKLVTRHPRSAAARSGLIDLGRLLERAGQTDRARCAYALFLERWPGHALGGDVARAHRALGEGPACRGLRPRDR